MNGIVEHGWVILDARGRPWDKHLYPTREAAETTAAQCISGGYSIAKAKRNTRLRQAAPMSLKLADDLIIEK